MKLPKGTRLAIRQALEKTHSAPERKRILARTQRLYNAFIREAPAPGGMNLLRSQYYGGLSVFAFYEAMDKNVEPDVLQEILWRMLLGGGDIRKRTPIRFPFSGTRLQKLSYAVLGKYAAFANKRVDSGRWKNTWKFSVNPEGHENGISMPLRNCPVAAFAKKHGYEHLMPLFCGSDFKVAERYDALVSRYEETEHKRDAVMEQIDQIMIRRRKIERFIESVKDLPELIAEFDEALWAGLVDSMTVHSKDRIVFQLTCGMEMEG